MAIFFLPKSRLKKFQARIEQDDDVVVIDVSSKSTEEWNVLSASYNHGEIPVPGTPGLVSKTVEGLWEGLKRLEREGENLELLAADKPKKRRLTKETGEVIGYLYAGETLRDELAARRRILIPAYAWVIKNHPEAHAKFEQLVELSRTKTLHIYDGGENGNLADPRPYAFAALLAEMLREARKREVATV